MRDTADAAGHEVAGGTPGRERALDFGVEAGGGGRPCVRSPAWRRDVFPGRPLRPLRDAVERTLDLHGTDEIGPGEEPDWSGLWRRSELTARLIQAFADHAVSCRAGGVLAPEPEDRELAAPVATLLGLPLETARPTEPSTAGPGSRVFPVARMLHDREVAGIGGRGELAGAATVIRIGASDSRPPYMYNILSFNEL